MWIRGLWDCGTCLTKRNSPFMLGIFCSHLLKNCLNVWKLLCLFFSKYSQIILDCRKKIGSKLSNSCWINSLAFTSGDRMHGTLLAFLCECRKEQHYFLIRAFVCNVLISWLTWFALPKIPTPNEFSFNGGHQKNSISEATP